MSRDRQKERLRPPVDIAYLFVEMGKAGRILDAIRRETRAPRATSRRRFTAMRRACKRSIRMGRTPILSTCLDRAGRYHHRRPRRRESSRFERTVPHQTDPSAEGIFWSV